MSKFDWTRGKLSKIIKDCDSFSDCLKKMKIPIAGNNIATLRAKLKEYNIDISHFTYGKIKKKKNGYVNVERYLTKNSSIKSSKLKNKLLKEGYKDNICECCGISKWNGKKITMQLHHIDGDNTNNELSNLQMLCPNCHSQTDNFCGSANVKHYYCELCGKEKKSKYSNLCIECSHKQRRKTTRPSKETLIKMFKETKNLTKMGQFYGVTSNTIVKWLKYYNLPYKINDLNKKIWFLKQNSDQEKLSILFGMTTLQI